MWIDCDSCGCLIDAMEDPEAYRQQIDEWRCPDCRPADKASDEDFYRQFYYHLDQK